MNSRSRVHPSWRIFPLAVSILLLQLGSSTLLAQDAGTVTLAQIHAQWRNRQQRTRSFEFKWKDAHIVAPDYIRGIHAPEGSTVPQVPDEESTYTEQRLLMMDGNKVRYEYEGWQPAWMTTSSDKPTYRRFISTVNSRENKTLLAPQGTRENYQGTIEADHKMRDWQTPMLAPLRFTFRMLDPVVGIHRGNELRIVARNVNLRGRSCVVLEGPVNTIKQVLYVDPQRAGIVYRRALTTFQDVVLDQLDVEFQRDPAHGWVPAVWTYVRPEGMAVTSKVAEYRINFGPDPSHFDLEFPAGTYLLDLKNKRDFIVRRGGANRLILPQEMGLSYEQLVATETGHGFQPSSSGRLQGLWWLGVALLGLISGLLIWRHHASSK